MKRIVKATTLAAAGCALVAGGAGSALAHGDSGASAEAAAVNSPGVLSGNVLQVPIAVPINLCGNTIDIVGILNPTFGNTCINK